jgi:hypothetical protein
MTTEISTNTAPARGLALATNDESSFDSLVHMGESLLRTGFLPSHIKNGVSFAAIVLMGRELGMGTMAACRKLQVIKGNVTERADSQLARFKSVGGKSEFKELTDTRAVLWLRHPNGDEHTETFSIEDAKRAGLSSNDNYSKHPKAMLRSRAITAGLKSIGWEGAVGIYDPDEIVDHPEPVRVRPKFDDTNLATRVQQSEIGIAPEIPDAPARATPDDMVKARHAVQQAKSVERLDAIRVTVQKRLLDEGFYTDAQADELFALIDGKVEIFGGSEVKT